MVCPPLTFFFLFSMYQLVIRKIYTKNCYSKFLKKWKKKKSLVDITIIMIKLCWGLLRCHYSFLCKRLENKITCILMQLSVFIASILTISPVGVKRRGRNERKEINKLSSKAWSPGPFWKLYKKMKREERWEAVFTIINIL